MHAEDKTNKTRGNGAVASGRLEAELWKTADALRGSMDAAEYKHVVLGLIFLKFRANVTIDWTVRENVRAHLRVLVKRILRRNGYPPDKQEQATRTVLKQAEALSQEWAVA